MTDATDQRVKVTIDGVALEASPGELVIAVAERAGVYIPRFCYHPRMEPVGVCRMCLVEVSSPRGFSLQPACFARVADGQEVLTASDKARKAQEGVIEFLLVNHPLDCPVCDKGGECPLQDQSLSHGPGESRFVEEKRHFAKPIRLGPFVELDRERCIQCARCTRFAAEIAGDAQIDFLSRGSEIEVARFPSQPFDSYFSGNTVQICPVGALTARPYRFAARPWDLEQVESTCTACSVGCRVVAQSSAGALVRLLGVDCEPVNQSWLCDKGRFCFEETNADSRLRSPELRLDSRLVGARWGEALKVAADLLGTAQNGVGIIGGAHLSNEDAYAWSRLAKSVLRTDSVDAQVGDGLPGEKILGLPRATIDEACAARVIVLWSGDLREELPVLYLRLRAAARGGSAVLECSPVASALSPFALRVPYLPGEAVRLAEALVTPAVAEVGSLGPSPFLTGARELLSGGPAGEPAGSGVVVVLGRGSVAESGQTIADAASVLAEALPGAKFLLGLRRANTIGALDMGLAPGLLPGRVALSDGRAHYESAWGPLAERPGEDAEGILRRAAAGELSVLVLLGADPLSDFPDRALAQQALEACPATIYVGSHRDPSCALADVVLPVAADGERGGTTTNVEGRVTHLAQKVVPPGVARAPWVVASELASRLGGEFGFDSLEALTDEIAAVVPGYAGIGFGRLALPDARDGIIPGVGTREPVAPPPIDPMATPGINSVEAQGAQQFVGAALSPGATSVEAPPDTPGHPAPIAPSRPSEPAVAHHLDAYSYRLVVTRRLYDRSTQTLSSASFDGLIEPASLGVHPLELARLGVGAGDRLRLRSAAGEIEVPVHPDAGLPRNVVSIQGRVAEHGDALELLDSAELATDVRLETT